MPDDRATRGCGPAECRCPLASPNDLWCADLKGEFKLGNGPSKEGRSILTWRFPPLRLIGEQVLHSAPEVIIDD